MISLERKIEAMWEFLFGAEDVEHNLIDLTYWGERYER